MKVCLSSDVLCAVLGTEDVLSKCLSHPGKPPPPPTGQGGPLDHVEISLREEDDQHLPPASMGSFLLAPFSR